MLSNDMIILQSSDWSVMCVKVHATDPDVERRSSLHYGLTGQFADDGTFVVNEHSGEVFLTRPLDRDPPRGRSLWNFNVLAHDEVLLQLFWMDLKKNCVDLICCSYKLCICLI